MATAEPDYYCHKCQVHIGHVSNFRCPHCRDTFIEEIDPPSRHSSSNSRNNRIHHGGTVQFHRATPYGNTTIFIGGSHPSNQRNQYSEQPNIGTFFQTVLGQMMGGQQYPFVMHNGSAAGGAQPANFEAFLTHFLNHLGENSGPAPASETDINSIPTVKITAAQAHDTLQCAICMEEFKENESAKRLPCSHHFHEECISRWLRMHGTCPTCRVTLDGNNTSNQEYYNIYPDDENGSSNHRRHDRNNPGSSSSNLYQFD